MTRAELIRRLESIAEASLEMYTKDNLSALISDIDSDGVLDVQEPETAIRLLPQKRWHIFVAGTHMGTILSESAAQARVDYMAGHPAIPYTTIEARPATLSDSRPTRSPSLIGSIQPPQHEV